MHHTKRVVICGTPKEAEVSVDHECCETTTIHGPFHRQYYSKKEKLECLEEYEDMLQKELDGVRERIQEFGKE